MTKSAPNIWQSRATDPNRFILHATAVAACGRALVLVGPSGTGKTETALSLMAFGATLICDDLVELRRDGDALVALPPREAKPIVELRHIGFSCAPLGGPTPVMACVDMRRTDVPRLPDPEFVTLLDRQIRLIQTSREGSFAPALWHYLTQSEPGPTA